MTIYLAGPWARKPEVRIVREQFEAAGITVCADWIDHHGAADDDRQELQRQAYHDMQQIDTAAAFVILALEKSEGKASEFMYAYMRGKTVIVVGDRGANIFYNLSEVRCVDTVEEAINALHLER